ncbi:MAG: CPBP family intramembrane metalloprotease [Myxococcales bacterium]|nr:MAG: CPBP family intramembrane metalloprotease [Myxococcales bacterium]
MANETAPAEPLPRGTTATFLAVTFGWSWSVGAACWAAGGYGSSIDVGHVVWGFVFMLGPAIGALVATRRMPWPRRREVLGLTSPRAAWLPAAWLIPFALIVAATLGSALLPGVRLRWPSEGLVAMMRELSTAEKAEKLAAWPAPLLSLGMLTQAVTGALFNVPFMLSEELGWRGLLWSSWRPLGFWPGALATGVVWGVWHAPLIALGHNYPGMPVRGPVLMVVFCVLLTPPLHRVREGGGSVWHAALFHGTVNGTAMLGWLSLVAPDWRGRGITGLAGFAVLLGAVGATAWERRRWPPGDRPGGEPSAGAPTGA